jgi:hypothetical protein
MVVLSDAGGDVPIACSLSASDYAARLDEIQAIGRSGLLRVERRSNAPNLIFRADPDIRSALERVIDAESECCPFLSFSMRSSGSEIVLSIEAPESADPVVRDLLDRFGLNEAPTT